jgi:Mg2+/Co2+ transporter CorB
LEIDPAYWQPAALLVLLALSAFFSMSETALIGADRLAVRSRVDAGDKRAKRLEALLGHPEKLLTTTLLGNNLVNIGATALATVMAVARYGENAGVIISTIAMTVAVLIFAEITPKSLAVRRAMPIALAVTSPLKMVQSVLYPMVVTLSAISRGLLALVGVKSEGRAPFITQTQIESLVRMGAQEGQVERFEERVITEVFDFTDTEIHMIMTRADHVRWIEKGATMREALELSAKSGHSRLPVVDGDFDHVMGFVHVKDLLRYTDAELAAEPVTTSWCACNANTSSWLSFKVRTATTLASARPKICWKNSSARLLTSSIPNHKCGLRGKSTPLARQPQAASAKSRWRGPPARRIANWGPSRSVAHPSATGTSRTGSGLAF